VELLVEPAVADQRAGKAIDPHPHLELHVSGLPRFSESGNHPLQLRLEADADIQSV
jgi:hypothetical protein